MPLWFGVYLLVQHKPVYPDKYKLLKCFHFIDRKMKATFIASNPSSLNIFMVPHHPQIRTQTP